MICQPQGHHRLGVAAGPIRLIHFSELVERDAKKAEKNVADDIAQQAWPWRGLHKRLKEAQDEVSRAKHQRRMTAVAGSQVEVDGLDEIADDGNRSWKPRHTWTVGSGG